MTTTPERSDPAEHHNPQQIDPRTAHQLVSSGPATRLDVREPQKWAAGHAPEASHLLISSGIRATNLTGGMQARQGSGLPVITGDLKPGTVA